MYGVIGLLLLKRWSIPRAEIDFFVKALQRLAEPQHSSTKAKEKSRAAGFNSSDGEAQGALTSGDTLGKTVGTDLI
jgi:hypothetical protein